jgi:hypothetical protein
MLSEPARRMLDELWPRSRQPQGSNNRKIDREVFEQDDTDKNAKKSRQEVEAIDGDDVVVAVIQKEKDV